MRALATWSGALAGLLLILIGTQLPVVAILPITPIRLIELPATWQVPAVLLCALVSGPRAGVMASVGYISLGLMDMPVFHSGGGLNYVLEPSFGYLAGFVPAAWITGRLSQQPDMSDLLAQTGSAIVGLVILQFCGLINLIIGNLFGRWYLPLPELIVQYSLGPLPFQIAMCMSAGLVAVLFRWLLLLGK